MTKSLKPILLFFELNFTTCCLTIRTIRQYLKMVQRMVSQLDQPVLLHLIHINVDCLTVPLFFSAEIKAIDLALDHIEKSRNTDFIIFSDSLSVLQSLHNRHIEHSILLDVLLKHNDLAELNHIVFCWIPIHVGIKGNEKADIAAKSALTLNISDLKIP